MENLDLLLVNSPLFREFNPRYDEDSLPPLGLGYIATMVSKAGFSVALVDAVADKIPFNSLIKEVEERKPENIAINIFTTNLNLVKEFVESVATPRRRVIIGGLSTRTLYEEIFSWVCDGNIDVVSGDGELIVPDILNGKEKQKPDKVQNNFRYFKVDTSSPYFCMDLSALSLDRSYFSNEPIIHPKGFIEANIVASRGCIYNCAFCAAARSLNKDLIIWERSTQSLIAELNEIQNSFPDVNSIRVLDDLFLKGPGCIENAIEVFSKSDLSWRSMAHVMTFNKVSSERLVTLRNSGCRELFTGIESGSPRVLKSIHKTHDVERIKLNLFRVIEAGIPVKGYFIYGFPGETVEDFEKTFVLASELKNAAENFGIGFRTSVFQFRPYHGTEIFHTLVSQGVNVSDIVQMEGNQELSSLIGRIQFNFHSGNYAAEPIEIVQEYIHKTANLSTAEDWGLE